VGRAVFFTPRRDFSPFGVNYFTFLNQNAGQFPSFGDFFSPQMAFFLQKGCKNAEKSIKITKIFPV